MRKNRLEKRLFRPDLWTHYASLQPFWNTPWIYMLCALVWEHETCINCILITEFVHPEFQLLLHTMLYFYYFTCMFSVTLQCLFFVLFFVPPSWQLKYVVLKEKTWHHRKLGIPHRFVNYQQQILVIILSCRAPNNTVVCV